MATIAQTQGARTLVLDMGALPSAAYVGSGVIDLGEAIPLDATFEVESDPNGAPTGKKQVVLFIKQSLDNVNFSSGPEGGTDATNEDDLEWLGTMSCADTTVHRKFFNLQGAPVTRYIRLVVKNETGVPLTSGKVYLAVINGVTA